MAASYTAYCFLVLLPPIVSVTPDTPSYLPWILDGRVNWWHIRGPGYPLVLIGMRSVTEQLFSVAVVQLVALVAVTCSLVHAVYRLTQRVSLATLVGVFLLLNATYMWQAMQAMSEALYAVLVTLFLAAVLRSARRPMLLSALTVGVIAACAVATRPTGYSLCAALPFLWFSWHRRRGKLTFAALVLCGIVLAALTTVNYQLRGYWGFQKFGGAYLALHSAWFMDDDTGSPNPELTQALLDLAKRYRDGYAEQKTWNARYDYTSRMLPFFLVESTDVAAKMLGIAPVAPAWVQPRFLNAYTPVLGFLARRTLERHPVAFARHVAEHYAGFWYDSLFSVPTFSTPWEPGVRHEYFKTNEWVLGITEAVFVTGPRTAATNPYAFRIPDKTTRERYLVAIDETPIFFDQIQSLLRRARPFLAAGAFVLSLWAAALAAWRWRRLAEEPILFSLGFASVTLHGYALNVALGSPTIPRYTFPYLPVAVFILVVGTWYFVRVGRSGATRIRAGLAADASRWLPTRRITGANSSPGRPS